MRLFHGHPLVMTNIAIDLMGFNGIYDGIAFGKHSEFANWKMDHL